MTRKSDLRRLADMLRTRRQTLQTAQNSEREELRALKAQERDPEYEEAAQSELADYTLSRLVENARRELLMIDAALSRIDEGSYGECIECGEDIAIERLEALPFAVRCEEDAQELERERQDGHNATPSL